MQRIFRTRSVKTGVWVCFLVLICGLSALFYINDPERESAIEGIRTSVQIETKDIRTHVHRDECSNVSLSEIKLPVTALASFHGSGSIWIRYLLQKLTGIATGSAYKPDKELINRGFPGEGREDESVIAIDTHSNYNGHKKYNKVVLLIRNPFQALLAGFRRISTYEDVGHHSLETFVAGWNDFFDRQIQAYHDFFVSWTKHPNVLLVFHDKLSSDLKHSLLQISSFVKARSVRFNIKCYLRDPDIGFYANKSQVLPSEYFYSKSQTEKINKTIMELQKIFSVRFKHEKLDNMKSWIMK